MTIIIVIGAFWLGACPFSLLVGRWLWGKDIRDYGDGNPGAANVFRAGGLGAGLLAVFLDVGKGVPFVFLATSFDLPEIILISVGVSAILGHAFSPLLQWRGGKAISVTFGVLLALPDHAILITFVAFLIIGFLFIEVDAWTTMFGAAGTLAYLVVTRGSSWQALFMLCVLTILAVKHFEELHAIPGIKGRLINWLQSRRRET